MSIDITKPNRAQTIGDVIDSSRANFVEAKSADDAHAADNTAHGLSAVNASLADYAAHKLDGSAHGMTAALARTTALEGEVTTARGSQSTLGARLDNALQPSGTIKLANIASKWITPGDVPTFLTSTTFSVPTDRRLVFIAGALLRLTVSGGYVYAPVASSAYGAVTTVTLDPAYPVLTAGLSALDLALIAFDNTLANAVGTLQSQMTALTAALGLVQTEVIEGFANGTLAANQVLCRFVAIRNFSIPINAVASQIKGTVNATASTTFNLQKNGVTFGTANVAAGAAVATFTVASATAFVAGDLLSIVAPAGADATLANLAYTLKGTLQ